MTEKDHILNKIEQVIAGAEQFKSDQFISILDGLVKKVGKDAEFLLVKYITMESLSAESRKKILQAAGQIRSSLYLVPLKKVLDQDPDIRLKKAAIMAISKYRSQQALNILNSSLPTVSNPLLQGTINEQINVIKKNNPLLALLPRFLKGDKDRKSFLVVLDILKKNLKSEEAATFINYLKSNDPVLRGGAFEVLCATADRTLQSHIIEFFYRWAGQLQGPESVSLMENMKHYLLRFPSLIFPQMNRLRELYSNIDDISVRKSIISIFCHCRAPEALTFIKEIYNLSVPELREFIIEESAGNEQAVEFLFEKYKAGQILKEKILKSLLDTQKGFTYFVQHFLTFSAENQKQIVFNLPDKLKPYMVNFIKTLFQSDLFHLKTFLIKRIKDNYLFSCKPVLFNSAKEKEYNALEGDYVDTITSLFPVSSVQQLLKKAAIEDLEVPRIKIYLKHILNISQQEVAINLRDSSLLPLLITKVINACSSELNEMILSIFENLKTFDIASYKNLYDALLFFVEKRGDNVVEEESFIIKRIKENYHSVLGDVKVIENLEKEVKHIFIKKVPDLVRLKKAINSYHLGIAFRIKFLVNILADYFKTIDEMKTGNWKLLFHEFPLIMQQVREAREIISKRGESFWNSLWESGSIEHKKVNFFHDKLRIVICFEERQIIAYFKDQIEEILPHFNTITGMSQLRKTDIFVCDSAILRDYIKRNALATTRVFVLMENRSEFAQFKSLNPRAFFMPLSIHRVLKLILQELYLLR